MKNVASLCLSLGFCMLAGMAVAASAQVKQGLPACTSKEYLRAISDVDSLKQLVMAGKCTVLKKGTSVVLIDYGFATSTILYNGNTLVTPSEAIDIKR